MNGVWTHDILPGIRMTVNYNINTIIVNNLYGSIVSYRCEDGITDQDIEQIKRSILQTTKVGSYQAG